MKEESSMKKILIADDSEFIRKVLKDILSPKYKIIMASNGKNTFKKYKNESPDLVLLDIIMPEGEETGLEVLKDIKEIDPDASIIMVTALGQKSMIEQCKKLGVKDYIIKPFDEKDVIKAVENFFKRDF